MWMSNTGGLWDLWTSENFLKELSAFSSQKLILLLTFCAKMLKHCLEYLMVKKCHLLFHSGFVLCCITSLDYISILSFKEVMLTCPRGLEGSRIKKQDCLMWRYHLCHRKFTSHKSTDAGRVFWINIIAYVPWLCYCSLGTCYWLETESGVRPIFDRTFYCVIEICFSLHIECTLMVLSFPINVCV